LSDLYFYFLQTLSQRTEEEITPMTPPFSAATASDHPSDEAKRFIELDIASIGQMVD
jgi:hypothetical protein